MRGLGYALELIAGVGCVIFIHELGHFLVAKWRGIKVEIFSIGFGSRLFGFRRGETEYRVSWIPLGGYVKMAGENPEESRSGDPSEFLSQPGWSRLLVVLAGPFMNIALGVVLFAGVMMIGARQPIVEEPIVEKVMASDSPAARAGLRSGDRITAVNGTPVATWEAMTAMVRSHPDVRLTLTVARGGTWLTLEAVPRAVKVGDGQIGQLGIQGQVTRYIQRRLPPGESLVASWRMTWTIIREFALTIRRLIVGDANIQDALRGPVGIVQIAVQEVRSGFISFLWFLAVISVNLAVVNLLPIPVLDGGHVLLIGLEILRGKPLSTRVQMVVQQIGLALLLTLVVYTTFHDLFRLK